MKRICTNYSLVRSKDSPVAAELQEGRMYCLICALLRKTCESGARA